MKQVPGKSHPPSAGDVSTFQKGLFTSGGVRVMTWRPKGYIGSFAIKMYLKTIKMWKPTKLLGYQCYIKTGYFEDPTPAMQVQTLPPKGPEILRVGKYTYPIECLTIVTNPTPQKKSYTKVVVSNIFYVHPYLGKISNLTSIFFQMGWFNHQTEDICIISTPVNHFYPS